MAKSAKDIMMGFIPEGTSLKMTKEQRETLTSTKNNIENLKLAFNATLDIAPKIKELFGKFKDDTAKLTEVKTISDQYISIVEQLKRNIDSADTLVKRLSNADNETFMPIMLDVVNTSATIATLLDTSLMPLVNKINQFK